MAPTTSAPIVYSPLEIGLPTIDRPFGIALWPLFERLFTPLAGYKPQDFRFAPGETPMSTFQWTATALVTYYIVVFGGRELMRSREAKRLNGLFMVHNFYLTVISGGLLALFLEQLIPTVVRKGVFYGICDYGGGWTDKLVILYYVSAIGGEKSDGRRRTNGCS
jgi:fatty acid elongase 3